MVDYDDSAAKSLTDEERWEIIERCLRLLNGAPKIVNHPLFGRAVRRAQVGDLMVTKYYGLNPTIWLWFYSLCPPAVVSFPARRARSRRLDDFVWAPSNTVRLALDTLRRHMILDDLAGVRP